MARPRYVHVGVSAVTDRGAWNVISRESASQPASQPAGWFLESTFCGWIVARRGKDRADNRGDRRLFSQFPSPLRLLLCTAASLAASPRERESGRKGRKEKARRNHLSVEHGNDLGRRERVRRGVTCNVKLSWLNTGQIYRTIDAFGPLQPAVVDISLRHRVIPRSG